ELKRIEPVFRRHHVESFASEQSTRDLAYGQRIVHDHDQRWPAEQGRGRSCGGGGLRGLDHHWPLDTEVDTLRELHWIDDKNDLARAQHCCAGNAGHAGELRADVFHNHFLMADDLVDVHRHARGAATKEQYGVMAKRLRIMRGM